MSVDVKTAAAAVEFVKQYTYDDNGGTVYSVWLQYNGNEAELEKLAKRFAKLEAAGEFTSQLHLKTRISEAQVDALCQHAETKNGAIEYAKITGKLTLPRLASGKIDWLHAESKNGTFFNLIAQFFA